MCSLDEECPVAPLRIALHGYKVFAGGHIVFKAVVIGLVIHGLGGVLILVKFFRVKKFKLFKIRDAQAVLNIDIKAVVLQFQFPFLVKGFVVSVQSISICTRGRKMPCSCVRK